MRRAAPLLFPDDKNGYCHDVAEIIKQNFMSVCVRGLTRHRNLASRASLH